MSHFRLPLYVPNIFHCRKNVLRASGNGCGGNSLARLKLTPTAADTDLHNAPSRRQLKFKLVKSVFFLNQLKACRA